MSKSYRLKCRNTKCGYETLKYYKPEEFDKLQYGSQNGIGCFMCGFPKMLVMRSLREVKDGFQPGFQRNIGKYCETYAEYKAHLKNNGLIEIGYEELQEQEDGHVRYWSDATIQNAIRNGVYLSGREIDALKDGKIDEI